MRFPSSFIVSRSAQHLLHLSSLILVSIDSFLPPLSLSLVGIVSIAHLPLKRTLRSADLFFLNKGHRTLTSDHVSAYIGLRFRLPLYGVVHNSSIIALFSVVASAQEHLQASSPAPSLDTGAAGSVSVSVTMIGASMILSMLAILKQ